MRVGIAQYLAERSEILRRLAFHVLSLFPAAYSAYVIRELSRPENFGDLSIHHELFQLLRHAYPTLDPADRRAALDLILAGPSPEGLRGRLQAQGEDPSSVDAYLQ